MRELLGLGAFVGLLLAGAGTGTRGGADPSSSRVSACGLNQQVIESGMMVLYTHGGGSLSQTDTGAIHFDTTGTVVKVTGPLARALEGWSPPVRVGSRALAEVLRLPRGFLCPAPEPPHGAAPCDRPHVEYRWSRGVDARSGQLYERAECLRFPVRGADGTLSRAHSRGRLFDPLEFSRSEKIMVACADLLLRD